MFGSVFSFRLSTINNQSCLKYLPAQAVLTLLNSTPMYPPTRTWYIRNGVFATLFEVLFLGKRSVGVALGIFHAMDILQARTFFCCNSFLLILFQIGAYYPRTNTPSWRFLCSPQHWPQPR